jgi:hypothetical protein
LRGVVRATWLAGRRLAPDVDGDEPRGRLLARGEA